MFGQHTFKGDNHTRTLQLAGMNQLTQERNRAYLFSILLILCLTGLAIAVTVLASIRKIVPVISVIDANGHVIKQQIVHPETIVGHESFVQSQIYDFITYCNTFDPDWRQRFSDLCRLHSAQAIARQYDIETAAENPKNPYYQIGIGGKRYPKITSITPLDKETYQIAFQSITEKPGTQPKIEYYTALVRYIFTYTPLALGDRWENPLGFATIAYRKDQELSRH